MSSSSQNGDKRLDRIERALELLINDHVQFREDHARFNDEHKKLLTAQVVLTDRVDKLAKTVADLAEAGKQTDERLNTLITIVDGVVRQRPPQ